MSTYRIMPDGRYNVQHKDKKCDGMREHCIDQYQLPDWIKERFEGKFGENDTII